jgi:hypothetical protein
MNDAFGPANEARVGAALGPYSGPSVERPGVAPAANRLERAVGPDLARLLIAGLARPRRERLAA